MRSRYAAFALGLGDYLVLTLSKAYPDKTKPVHDPRQKFAGLRISKAEGDEVTFHATIYVGGADASCTERSRFVNEDGKWRYDRALEMT
jgi:SEC-C motif-containing protein